MSPLGSRFLGRLTAVIVVAAGVSSASARATCPTRSSWPTTEWPSRIGEVASARAAEIAALEQAAFTLVGRDEERRGVRTDGLLIVHRGELIYERYARGYDATKRHLGWSVTKSVTSALMGVAVHKGALTLDTPLCDHLRAERAENCVLTPRHLIEFASGLEWRETYENQSYQVSSVIAMLFGEGRRDLVRFITGHARAAAPGTRYKYSTGDSALLASVVRAAMLPRFGEGYAWDLLFDRIGMRSATQERDVAGNPLGGSHFYATPRDLARFGFLYLNDGCWAGERLLPEGWVRDSTVPSAGFRAGGDHSSEANGWQWWLNRPVPHRGIASPPWPSAPEDAYAAKGHWGQYVVVIPSLDLVIVRTGDDRNNGMGVKDLIPLAMAVAR